MENNPELAVILARKKLEMLPNVKSGNPGFGGKIKRLGDVGTVVGKGSQRMGTIIGFAKGNGCILAVYHDETTEGDNSIFTQEVWPDWTSSPDN